MGVVLNRSTAQRVLSATRRVEAMPKSLAGKRNPPLMGGGGRGFFTARITGATKDGANDRWTYTVAEGRPVAGTPWTWEAVTGGRTGDAYNRYEIPALDSTDVTILRIPNGRPVHIEIVRDSDGEETWWFSEANDVECNE
jgi:hypothetical protein